MNPFDYAKALTDFWSTQAQTMMKAQAEAGAALAGGMKAMSGGAMASPESSAEMTRAGQAMMELWSGASALMMQLSAKMPQGQGDGAMDAVLGKIMDPRQWMTGSGDGDEMLGRMAEGPRLADMWQIERRYAAVLQASMEVRRRGFEHNAVMLKAWTEAAKRFTDELAGRSGTDGRVPEGKAAMALWTETANRQLLTTQRSEEFLASQRETIRANTALRMAQRELIEYFGEQYGFPTRTELDDVHRTVTELRRELREMRRQQRKATPPRPEAANANPSRRGRAAGGQRGGH